MKFAFISRHVPTTGRLCDTFLIGVFENANRAQEGEKPSFEAVSFHIFPYL